MAAEVKADEDTGWLTTVSGIYGSAIGQSDGVSPNWGTQNAFGVPTGNGTGTPQGAAPAPPYTAPQPTT